MVKTTSSDPAVITEEVIAAAGQSANIFSIKNSGGTELFTIDSSGVASTSAMGESSFVMNKVSSTYYIRSGTTGAVIYSGTNAATVLQAAIDALTAGGKIFIKAGVYTFTTGITITYPISIEGEGNGLTGSGATFRYGTVLNFSTSSPAITIPLAWSQPIGVRIANLNLYNTGTTPTGILLDSSRMLFENLLIENFTQFGVQLNGHMNTFIHCSFWTNGTSSPSFGGIAIGSTDGVMIANNNTFIGCKFEGNGSGVCAYNGYSNSWDGCTFEGNNYHGMNIVATPTNGAYPTMSMVKTADFESNNMASAASIYDIYLPTNGSSYWTFENLVMASALAAGPVATYGVVCCWRNIRCYYGPFLIDPSSIESIVDNVNVDGATPFAGSFPWPVNIRKRGKGLTVQGQVTILSGQTSITVTHGLDAAPQLVSAIGSTADTASLYVDNIGATTFIIHASGAVGGNRTIYWSAEV